MMKLNRNRKITALALKVSLLAVVISFQGCGGQMKKTQFSSIEEEVVDGTNNNNNNNNNNGNGNPFTPGPGPGPGGDTMKPVENKTAAVSNSEQVLTAMLTVTGVTTPSAATRAAYTREAGKITETGKVDSVNAPMWLALTNLAGEVCNDLLTQEAALAAAQRRIFGQVDLAAAATAAAVSDAAKNDVIRRLARSVWQRNETPEEATMIKAALGTSFATGTARNAMLYTCTAMLSSLDAHDL